MAWCCGPKGDGDLEMQAQEIIKARDSEIAKLKKELKQAQDAAAHLPPPLPPAADDADLKAELRQRDQRIKEMQDEISRLRAESKQKEKRSGGELLSAVSGPPAAVHLGEIWGHPSHFSNLRLHG